MSTESMILTMLANIEGRVKDLEDQNAKASPVINDDPCKDLPNILDVHAVMIFLGYGKTKSYELMRQEGFSFGNTVRITRSQLRDWMFKHGEVKA